MSEFPKVAGVSRGCLGAIHPKRVWHYERATAQNSNCAGGKESRVHALPSPTPFANSPCHLDTKWETTRRQPTYPFQQGVCVPYCLCSRALSSNSVKQLTPSLCVRAGVEIGGNEHRARERGQTKTTTTPKLVAGWLACEWGHRGWNAAAGEPASAALAGAGDVTAPRKMPGIDVTVLSQPASGACLQQRALSRSDSIL